MWNLSCFLKFSSSSSFFSSGCVAWSVVWVHPNADNSVYTGRSFVKFDNRRKTSGTLHDGFKYVYMVDTSTKYFVARQRYEENVSIATVVTRTCHIVTLRVNCPHYLFVRTISSPLSVSALIHTYYIHSCTHAYKTRVWLSQGARQKFRSPVISPQDTPRLPTPF